MKRILSALFVLVIASSGWSQQIGQFSQYFLNKSLLNPAAMGLNSKLNVTMGYRSQWSGFDGAPQSYFLTGSMVLGEHHKRLSYVDKSIRVSNPDLFKMVDSTTAYKHVVGGSIFGNSMVPLSSTSTYASYAFHYPIHEFMIAAGASLGVTSLKVDFAQITVNEQNDQNYNRFLQENSNTTFMDFNFGAMVYSHNFYLSYSTTRLAANKVRFSKDALSSDLNTHHYFSTGLKIHASDEFILKPSVLLRFIAGAPASYDVNVLVDFHHMVYGGVSYRHGDAVVGVIGFLINNHYNVSYSYDVTTSGLKDYSNGTHEIMLGVRI